jgi:hypothetical protein
MYFFGGPQRKVPGDAPPAVWDSSDDVFFSDSIPLGFFEISPESPPLPP